MLRIERESNDEETVLRVVGVVDEHADLSALGGVTTGTLVLDLGGVERINSMGVSEWIRALGAVPDQVRVLWDAVSPAMVTQLGMIANFAGRGRIRTFQAPYYCAACDSEQRFLLAADDVTSTTAPLRTCGRCGSELVFDDVEEDYLGGIRSCRSGSG